MREAPSHMKAQAHEAAGALLAVAPGGFKLDDVALRLGAEFCRPGDERRRLWKALDRLTRTGVLERARHGVFVAGGLMEAPEAAGSGVRIAESLRRLFRDGGGFVRPKEARMALGLHDVAGERALARAAAGGGYGQGLPALNEYRNVWWVRDEMERAKLVLPGAWVALDVRFEIARRGGAWDAPSVRSPVHARWVAIGESVRSARCAAGFSVEEVAADADVSEAMAKALERSVRNLVRGGRLLNVGEWWRERVAAEGMAPALAMTLDELESRVPPINRDIVEPTIAGSMDAAFWRAIGTKLSADPVGLSRAGSR
jgi:hypothetical protein